MKSYYTADIEEQTSPGHWHRVETLRFNVLENLPRTAARFLEQDIVDMRGINVKDWRVVNVIRYVEESIPGTYYQLPVRKAFTVEGIKKYTIESNPKYLWRSDGERWTKQTDGDYSMDSSKMRPRYKYSYETLINSGFKGKRPSAAQIKKVLGLYQGQSFAHC